MTVVTLLLIILGVCLAILLLLFFWGVGIYNGLVTARNRFKNAFAQIDIQLKRRYDLIPNLVETARGYMQHEKGTLESVVQARSAAMGAQQRAATDPGDADSMKSFSKAEGDLSGALGRLMLVVESYPDLKASQNMLSLQEELATTENKISFARQAYNDAAMLFNNQREVFPSNIVAGVFNFKEASLWVIEDEKEKVAPTVKF